MSISDKNFYNESSALKLGWDPSWFGAKLFDEKLVTAIRKFQKNHGMGADGLCGPSTYRRALTKREFEKKFSFYKSKHGDKFLHYGDAKIPVDWDKVVTYKDFGHGFDISSGLRSWNRKTNRTIKSFVKFVWFDCHQFVRDNPEIARLIDFDLEEFINIIIEEYEEFGVVEEGYDDWVVGDAA